MYKRRPLFGGRGPLFLSLFVHVCFLFTSSLLERCKHCLFPLFSAYPLSQEDAVNFLFLSFLCHLPWIWQSWISRSFLLSKPSSLLCFCCLLIIHCFCMLLFLTFRSQKHHHDALCYHDWLLRNHISASFFIGTSSYWIQLGNTASWFGFPPNFWIYVMTCHVWHLFNAPPFLDFTYQSQIT